MRFSFEEAELINGFFESSGEQVSIISRLEQARDNTEEKELIEIADSTIKKISLMDEKSFNKVFSDMPIDPYTEY